MTLEKKGSHKGPSPAFTTLLKFQCSHSNGPETHLSIHFPLYTNRCRQTAKNSPN